MHSQYILDCESSIDDTMANITEKKERICIYDPGAGPITVTLKVTDFITAGADFKLIYPTMNKVLEEFKLSIKESGYARHQLHFDLADLHKLKMVWQILYCSINPRESKGTIKVEFTQMNKPCRLTIPTEWEVGDIPPMQINRPDSLSASLTFMKREIVPLGNR